MKRSKLEFWERKERGFNELHEMLAKSEHFARFEESAWSNVLMARDEVEREQAEIDRREGAPAANCWRACPRSGRACT